ncbi:polynucleotide adenylyltransferase PcnB [Aliidiomarina sanyensis]|uniref:Poly(A) polymerase I n=1 Tax=Aliidiomarina sanyensis TaxID=1249555 RepID=A0A432WCM3_9GAMM|nr:polynucleotide adenylyltransferase PcnB [Aliidiomarina sanyensis]RUO30193.1 polynucleotide adenylyltransferase PcnB [Aliidiomarina sanyensis]
MPRSEHPISRDDIPENALKVLYRLHKAGFEAYLVGGCVRDLLLGVTPKDFDVATNASPEQIKGLFRNCRLIGRRFRLAHIVYGKDIIEVATFRGHHPEDEDDSGRSVQPHAKQNDQGLLLRDNVYGTIDEDAQRRDFTVNALYYSIADFAIYDFANGIADLEAGRLRLIGDPEQRYREDPVRMLRAVRFATKLGLRIEEQTAAPIKTLAPLLENIPPARLFEEFLKLTLHQRAEANFELLHEYGLFTKLFPMLKSALKQPESFEYRMTQQVFADTDARLREDKGVNPAYLFAALLWYPVQAHAEEIMAEGGLAEFDAFAISAADVVGRQVRSIAIPKRFSLPMRDIWMLQLRLRQKQPRRAIRLLSHPKFRAGYDFLLLRARVENHPSLRDLGKFWTDLQKEHPQALESAPQDKRSRSGTRRGRRPRRRKPSSNNG